MIDRVARDRVIDAFEDFLDEKIMAFEFDERLQDIDSADQTVNEVVRAAWFHYDDCTDHKVRWSKEEWDYFQRLLLILQSDAELSPSHSRAKYWSWDHALAWLACAVFVGTALIMGWGWQLFPLVTLFGILSISIDAYRRRQARKPTPDEIACFPFESSSQIRWLLSQTPRFQKLKYRPELTSRTIRSVAVEDFNWMLSYCSWMLLSPVALLIQGFPSRVDSPMRIIKR
jgi:hypothetical protein